MSKGISGLFKGTAGMKAAAGSAVYVQPGEDYVSNISKRKDKDVSGYFDVVAHGTSKDIQIWQNGEYIKINHRQLARMLKNQAMSNMVGVRLLSCETGRDPCGFAQNLANKIGMPVKAPTELVLAYPNGYHMVAGAVEIDGTLYADSTRIGRYITFFPRRIK